MRYYDLTLTDPTSGNVVRHWTTHPKGVYDPAALNISFDMIIAPYGTPAGLPTLLVEGVSLTDIGEAADFASKGLIATLKAGMAKGLPLANPNEAGTIVVGQIFQSFGNWEGTDMVLNLVLAPSIYGYSNPGNFTLNWPAGVELSTALQNCLKVAYPIFPISINIKSGLTLSYDINHHVGSLDQLADFVSQTASVKFNDNVYISMQGGKIIVYDDQTPRPVKQLLFTDIIGQPVWISPQIMQIKMVMRADLALNDIIKMPVGMLNAPGFIITTPASFPSSEKYKTSFQGTFSITELRQVGNLRSTTGADWVTIINCAVYGN